MCKLFLNQEERLKYTLFYINTYHYCGNIFLINSLIDKKFIEVSHVRKEKVYFACSLKIKILIVQLFETLILKFEEFLSIIISLLPIINDCEIIVWSIKIIGHYIFHLLKSTVVKQFDLFDQFLITKDCCVVFV